MVGLVQDHVPVSQQERFPLGKRYQIGGEPDTIYEGAVISPQAIELVGPPASLGWHVLSDLNPQHKSLYWLEQSFCSPGGSAFLRD
jgi:hypothetical protein